MHCLSRPADRSAPSRSTVPDQRNSLPPAEWLHLRDVLQELAADREARVVVLRGAGGRAFSSGYDIGALRELEEQGIVLSTPDDPFEVALAAVVEHPLPIIAMVGGYAVGGGCTLAAGCDVRIVGASSQVRDAASQARAGLQRHGAAAVRRSDRAGPDEVDVLLRADHRRGAGAPVSGWWTRCCRTTSWRP